MKKIVYLFIFIGLTIASCNKEQPLLLTKAQVQKRIDSITAIQVRESNEQAQRDLDHRIKIEVKVKVDSILNAKLHPKAKETTPVKTSIVPQKKGSLFLK